MSHFKSHHERLFGGTQRSFVLYEPIAAEDIL